MMRGWCNKTCPKYTYHCLRMLLMSHICGCQNIEGAERLNFLFINLARARKYSFLVIWKPKQYNCPYWQHYHVNLKSRFLCRFGHIWTCSNRFSKVHTGLNLEPNVMFCSSCSPNFELNFSQVQRSSGLNQGSELNYGSTKWLAEHEQHRCQCRVRNVKWGMYNLYLNCLSCLQLLKIRMTSPTRLCSSFVKLNDLRSPSWSVLWCNSSALAKAYFQPPRPGFVLQLKRQSITRQSTFWYAWLIHIN